MPTRNALTLAELVLALCILVALSSLVIPMCSNTMFTAAETVTQATLSETRDAMLQYWQDTKLVALNGLTTTASENQRFDIRWLFKNPVDDSKTIQFNPNTRSGWNGPYLSTATGDATVYAVPTMIDGWNRAVTVHYVNPNDSLKDVRIVSAGPNGVFDIPAGTATSALTTNSIGDDIYVALELR